MSEARFLASWDPSLYPDPPIDHRSANSAAARHNDRGAGAFQLGQVAAISRHTGFPVPHSLIPYTDATKRIIVERLTARATPMGTDASDQQNERDVGDMTMGEFIAHLSREPQPTAVSENYARRR